ncbi:hypothetical protein A2755_01685 [Candidatus Wolfebacteria bacterium RIFCSPHIGHO2_01_FULL_48_22]|uniref:Uncharacterized protein n=2 Tax=Candidatus Wolfeibacteriota TaxID=1752735 RepID=A0A1F8DQI9_9BACT|nr:MAG: hypothetical protein A2755_01685 [Candidatus Wolfebacteria bacterium RIFCSPHIGHO2_01_FULL_48_22]OGM91948.1 MAG: hypothetical protein A2935_02325 [Candidatus Wolfebacteria bacterium RIFCSPLOWO2_01_FULL_47_17b]
MLDKFLCVCYNVCRKFLFNNLIFRSVIITDLLSDIEFEVSEITKGDIAEVASDLDEVVLGEAVIGELTEEEKRWKAYLSKSFRRLSEEIAEHLDKHQIEIGESKEDCEKFRSYVRRQKEKLDLVKNIFWTSVQYRIKYRFDFNIGVRKDWKIVSLPSRSGISDFFGILKSL